jgi:hypothetical protein
MGINLKDKTIEAIQVSLGKSPHIEEPAYLERLLNEVIGSLEHIVENTSREIILKYSYFAETKDPERCKKQLEQRITELKIDASANLELLRNKGEIQRVYGSMHRGYIDIRDNKKIISDLDRAEKWRFFCFRMLTAAGIATIILLTSYIAHCVIKVPLPLSTSIIQ